MMTTAGGMEMDSKDFETRLQSLEDVDAIKKLKHQYCRYCDANYDADGIAALYTEDAVWEGTGIGKFEGREAIRKFFKSASKSFKFAIHNVMNPIIDVQGDRATAEWKLLQPCTVDGRAVWLAGVYSDEYVRVGGKWLFQHLKVKILFLTPYEDGWVRKQFVDGFKG
jgi:ketosteroid isomerase-like protein